MQGGGQAHRTVPATNPVCCMSDNRITTFIFSIRYGDLTGTCYH